MKNPKTWFPILFVCEIVIPIYLYTVTMYIKVIGIFFRDKYTVFIFVYPINTCPYGIGMQ